MVSSGEMFAFARRAEEQINGDRLSLRTRSLAAPGKLFAGHFTNDREQRERGAHR
jgi:hypothetical protein